MSTNTAAKNVLISHWIVPFFALREQFKRVLNSFLKIC